MSGPSREWVVIATPAQVAKFNLIPGGPMLKGVCFLCKAEGEHGAVAAPKVAAGAPIVCYECAPRAIALREVERGPCPVLATVNLYGNAVHPEMDPRRLLSRARTSAEAN